MNCDFETFEEKFSSDSYQINGNPIVFTIYNCFWTKPEFCLAQNQSKFRLVLNQLEEDGKYNLVGVDLDKNW